MRHPAKFSDALLPVIRKMLGPSPTTRVLDPFAGSGRVHELGADSVGIEIEPEWAALHPCTQIGDALDLPFGPEEFDAIVTSPTYGNRMADHHDAKDDSRRNTYKHALGRDLHPHNSGQLQWGPAYREFHAAAWEEAIRVLRPGGDFILNVSDHIRRKTIEPVTDWHVGWLTRYGLSFLFEQRVETPRNRQGENGAARVPYESVILFAKSTL